MYKKKKQLKLDLTKKNQAWVALCTGVLRISLCAVTTSLWPEQKFKPSKSVRSGIKKKETYPVTNRLLKVFSSNFFAVWGFGWKSTAWYILNNQNHIVSNRIGPNSYLDTTTRGFLMMIHFVFELFTRETVQWIILDHKRKSSSLSTWLKDEIMLWR